MLRGTCVMWVIGEELTKSLEVSGVVWGEGFLLVLEEGEASGLQEVELAEGGTGAQDFWAVGGVEEGVFM